VASRAVRHAQQRPVLRPSFKGTPEPELLLSDNYYLVRYTERSAVVLTFRWCSNVVACSPPLRTQQNKKHMLVIGNSRKRSRLFIGVPLRRLN